MAQFQSPGRVPLFILMSGSRARYRIMELSLSLPDDMVHVYGFAGDDKGPAKSLLQWPRPMLFSGIADLSR